MAIVLVVGGVLALWYLWSEYPPEFSVELLILVAAALLSENYAVGSRGFSVSLAFPMVLAASILLGPTAAVLVAAVTFTNASELLAGRPAPVYWFNFGQAIVWGLVAGLTYRAAGGISLASGVALADAFPQALLATVVASAAATTSNMATTSVGAAALRGVAPWVVLRSLARYFPTQIVLGFAGLLIAHVSAISPLAFLLFLFPLFLAREVYQQHESLRRAYVDTVRSLVGALEAKDPYTRGHSERVARYAVRIASQMGADVARTTRVEQAALLHDIGKLSLPAELVAKPSALTAREMVTMQSHPTVGAQMVAGIPPLKPLAIMLESHHERIDGGGYPRRLTGAEIPMESRILAVADAYDAMTTDRPYRPAFSHEEALEELGRGAGTQFDPDVVSAFIAADCSRLICSDSVVPWVPSVDGAGT